MSQTEYNNTAYPYRVICLVEVTFASGATFSGTGVLVGRNDVLTAAHLVYDNWLGAATKVTVTFAYDPSPYEAPYGEISAHSWSYFTDFDPDGDGLIYTGNGGAGLEGSELDIALISLDSAIGDQLGWMGLDPNFSGGLVEVAGYPALYGYNPMVDVGYVVSDPFDYFLDISGLEIRPGNSGGPVFYNGLEGPYVVGIVSTSIAAAEIAGTFDQVLFWMEENDSLLLAFHTGSTGKDNLSYGAKDDQVALLGGDDIVFGGKGNDHLDGGDGCDMARYLGLISQYEIIIENGAPIGVNDLVAYRDGTDSLLSIERLKFTDAILAFDLASAQAYRLYQAAFDRSPDRAGLSYWVDLMDKGMSLAEVAWNFIYSAEFKSIYGTAPSTEVLVDRFYENILGRDGDNAGFDYWVNTINDGVDLMHVLAGFSESSENIENLAPVIGMGINLDPLLLT